MQNTTYIEHPSLKISKYTKKTEGKAFCTHFMDKTFEFYVPKLLQLFPYLLNCYVSSITMQFVSKTLTVSGRIDFIWILILFLPKASFSSVSYCRPEMRLVCLITSEICKANILLCSSSAACILSLCIVTCGDFTLPPCSWSRHS